MAEWAEVAAAKRGSAGEWGGCISLPNPQAQCHPAPGFFAPFDPQIRHCYLSQGLYTTTMFRGSSGKAFAYMCHCEASRWMDAGLLDEPLV